MEDVFAQAFGVAAANPTPDKMRERMAAHGVSPEAIAELSGDGTLDCLADVAESQSEALVDALRQVRFGLMAGAAMRQLVNKADVEGKASFVIGDDPAEMNATGSKRLDAAVEPIGQMLAALQYGLARFHHDGDAPAMASAFLDFLPLEVHGPIRAAAARFARDNESGFARTIDELEARGPARGGG